MPAETASRRASPHARRPRKWGNRRPEGKRLDVSVEEAMAREIEREEKRLNRPLSVRLTRAEKETVESARRPTHDGIGLHPYRYLVRPEGAAAAPHGPRRRASAGV